MIGRHQVFVILFAALPFAAACGDDGISESGGDEQGGDGRGGGDGPNARSGGDSGLVDAADDGGADSGRGDTGAIRDGGAKDASVPDGGADAGPRDAGPDDSGTVDDLPRLAEGIVIREVAIFQGVKVTIGRSGAPVQNRNAEIVAGREAFVRVYFDLGQGWKPQAVAAETVVDSAGKQAVFTAALTPSAPSTEQSLSSTFNVKIPGENVGTDARLSVRLVASNGAPTPPGSAHDARFPPDGSFLGLNAKATGGPINLVLVPMRYDTDGSGRLPDTGPHMLGAIENLFTSAYPADRIEITVRSPVPWDEDLSWGGGVDFNKLNQLMADLKEQDGAESGAYYYGLIKPNDTFAEYCAWVCVAGQSWVVDNPADGAFRAGSGVAFDLDQTSWTCAHETGHMHGRRHAPCSTYDSDPSYPYSGGKIGVWGWDRVSNALFSPDTYTDFMGYCENQWVSDYTWDGLFDRIAAVNALPPPPPPTGGGARFRFLDVFPEGSHRWGRTVRFRDPPRGRPVAVGLFGERGGALGTTSAARFDHAHGGGATFLIDEPTLRASFIELHGREGTPRVRIKLE